MSLLNYVLSIAVSSQAPCVPGSQGSNWTPSQASCLPGSQGSNWTPSQASCVLDSQGSNCTPSLRHYLTTKKKKALENVLMCGLSPVEKKLSCKWPKACDRTKTDYINKSRKVFDEVIKVLAQNQEESIVNK